MAYVNGCRHDFFVRAEAKALPHAGASALVCAGQHAAAHPHAS